MSARDSAIDARKKALREEIDDYTNQKTITNSFVHYVTSIKKGKLVPEPQVARREGHQTDGLPDFLYSSGIEKVVIDIKSIRSQSEQTYKDRIEELKKYQGVLSYDGETFKAELAALCPRHLVKKYEPPEGICAIGYEVEDGFISLGPSKNRVRNLEFRDLFSGVRLDFPIRFGFKFLRHPAPLAYTAEVVHGSLLQASEFNLTRIDIKRTEVDALRRSLRGTFPPYLKSKTGDLIPQISDGLIEKALVFLERHEWIKRQGEFIEVIMNKGERSGSVLDTFIQLQAQDEFAVHGEKIAVGIPEPAETLDRLFES